MVIAGVSASIYWGDEIKAVWYSATYRVPFNKVHIAEQPSDCDFWSAPLGKKGCHYESTLSAYNGAGDVVGGDNAPKYGYDTKTGKPIISRDNGTTWDWLPGSQIPDPKVKSVAVSWFKVKD